MKIIITAVIAITLLGYYGAGYVDEPRIFSEVEKLGLGLFASLSFVLSFHGPELIAFFKGTNKE